MQPAISVRNLYKIFGDRAGAALERLNRGEDKKTIFEATGATVGVQDATFDVAEGEIFVVMGLSGSGKSTLVRMLNGLITPTSGEIIIGGEDVARCRGDALRRIRRETVAMVFQHFALFPHWTVADNAAYGLKIKGVAPDERRRRALRALEQVGLAAWADSLPSALSGGMQQRVGLARGLATEPHVLLMDEPFGALDPLIRREMQDELVALQKTLKKTIVFITHDLNEAMLLGNRIAIMKDGRFVQVGTAQEIVANPADDYVAAFVADIDRGRVFTAGDVAAEPVAVQLGSMRVVDGLRMLEELGLPAFHVLDGERIAGVVNYATLVAAIRDGRGLDLLPAGTLNRACPTASPDTPLQDLYAPAGAGLPIAVTGRDGRLAGVVAAEAVLAKLSRGPYEAAGRQERVADA